jgi:hypothetical protein
MLTPCIRQAADAATKLAAAAALQLGQIFRACFSFLAGH